MTREEAKSQVEAFFKRLGEPISVFENGVNHARAEIGRALLIFEFTDEKQLACVALIHRFEEKPSSEALTAIEDAVESDLEDRIRYDDFTKTLFLERLFETKIDDGKFYAEMKNLADSSLVWRNDFFNSGAAGSPQA